MTAKQKIAETHRLPALGSLVFGFMCAFSLIMILKNSAVAIEYMRAGLRLCAAGVIPSLFPFMVISELVVASGMGNSLARILGKPFGWLFGISRESCAAILLGCVCGFPVGAKTAITLYDSGAISAKEAERLLAICNIPSSGFLISAVGIALYGDRRFGIFLYLAALTSVLAWGFLLARLRPIPLSHLQAVTMRKTLGADTFTGAISSATASMLAVCAYVVFFTSVVGCLSHMLDALSLSSAVRAFLFGVFEISSGVNAAASLGSSATGLALCGFVVGWSGISVHFQILSLCGGRGLSFRPYLLGKLFQGLFCGACCYRYAKILSPALAPGMQDAGAILLRDGHFRYAAAMCLVFLLCVIGRYGYRRKR